MTMSIHRQKKPHPQAIFSCEWGCRLMDFQDLRIINLSATLFADQTICKPFAILLKAQKES